MHSIIVMDMTEENTDTSVIDKIDSILNAAVEQKLIKGAFVYISKDGDLCDISGLHLSDNDMLHIVYKVLKNLNDKELSAKIIGTLFPGISKRGG